MHVWLNKEDYEDFIKGNQHTIEAFRESFSPEQDCRVMIIPVPTDDMKNTRARIIEDKLHEVIGSTMDSGYMRESEVRQIAIELMQVLAVLPC